MYGNRFRLRDGSEVHHFVLLDHGFAESTQGLLHGFRQLQTQFRQTGGKDYLRNERLLVYNELMKQAAMEKKVAFLDLNPVFADETGQLPADDSRDGVHLRGEACKRWLEYLKTHTVEYETLYPDGEETENETNDAFDADAGVEPDGVREEPAFL